MNDKEWFIQHRFVLWFSTWANGGLVWAGSCPCHQDLFELGSSNTCDQKGRILHLAHQHFSEIFDSALAEAEQWSPLQWGSLELLGQLQGSVRMIVSVGREMFAYLDVIPYLLSRLHQPGVAARVIAQFDSRPLNEHHRVSAEFLAVGSILRLDIAKMKSDGTGMSPLLAAEVKSLMDIPCDDTINEGPHSRFHRIVLASRRAHFAWQAATLRLLQNVSDARELVPIVQCDAQKLWNNYTSILQTKPSRNHIPVRCTRKVFERRLYTLGSTDGFREEINDADLWMSFPMKTNQRLENRVLSLLKNF